MNTEKKDSDLDEKKEELNAEDDREIELFVQNSQIYGQKIYGKTFCDEDVDELRKEIKANNEAVNKVKTEWGLA